MLEKLGEVLRKATDKVTNAIFLDKNLVEGIIRDLQRALIEADVSIPLVKDLSEKIRKAAFDERIKGVEKKEHLIKVLHDNLTEILGQKKDLKLLPGKKQNKILLLGLYGSGKSTTTAKLGNYYAKRGRKVALVGLDVHRPAASEQLQQLAEKHKLHCFIDLKEKNPAQIWKNLEKRGALKEFDIVIIDTAGRHTLDRELVSEIKNLDKTIKPTENILVLPADIGQAAKRLSQEFLDAVKISGVIITRMDSSAKGGGALTACAETHAPVYFITTGEKINDIETFNPESFLSRLLGMGDLQALIEKVHSAASYNEARQAKMQKQLEEGEGLTLDDVIEQVKSMNSLGGLDKIKSMIPGLAGMKAKIPENVLENQEAKISKWEHIVKSMTPRERAHPEILEKQTSRIGRIAQGAGVNNSDVRALLKQYKILNEMVTGAGKGLGDMSQGMSQKQMQKLARKFGKMKKMRF